MSHLSRFIIALAVSSFIHAVALVSWPGFMPPPAKPDTLPLEITYQNLLRETKVPKALAAAKKTWEVGDAHKKDTVDEALNYTRSVELQREFEYIPDGLSQTEKEHYLAYYEAIRQKIKDTARRYYRSYIVNGNIHLRFSVTADGSLDELLVMEEGTSGSAILKRLALQSVKSAHPFPEFPKELTRDKLCFNVVISFRRQHF